MYPVFPKMFDGTCELRSVPDGHGDVFQGRDELWLVLGRVVLWKIKGQWPYRPVAP